MTAAPDAIYLDNNASTPLLPEVLDAMVDCLAHCHGNPSSQHRAGQAARERLVQARAAVATLVGAAAAQVVFTASATEANHMAILGALASAPGARRIVTSSVEHPATLRLLARLEEEGCEVSRVAVDGTGALDLDSLRQAIADGPALVSLMWANNETGVCFPVAQVAQWTRAAGVLFHCDAVQAAGRVPIDLAVLPIDLLTVSAHKLHGPKGVGALFLRKGLAIPPLVAGHQERHRRGGTENLPGIVGFGVAAQAARSALATAVPAMAALRDDFERGLLARHPGIRVHGAGQPRVCNTSSLCVPGIPADELLTRLDLAGVAASGGAACAAGGSEPSHVLMAMGLSRNDALSTIRISLSRLSHAAELRRVAGLLDHWLAARAAQAA